MAKKDPNSAADADIAKVDTALEQSAADAATQVRKDVQQTDDDISTLTHLVVRSLGASFRRAGRLWTREAQVVAKSLFTDEQVAALKAEPALAVQEVAAPVAAPSATASAPAAAPKADA